MSRKDLFGLPRPRMPRFPRGSKRPQNVCDRCGYTWHPRGKDTSLKCPKCNSSQVKQVPGCVLLLAALTLLSLAASLVALVRTW